MEYLKIKRSKQRVRADGSAYAVPLFVTKTCKYGKTVSEQNISTKKPIMVTGAHDSGKTRWMQRLHENCAEIWGAKIKAEPLYLNTISPLAAWTDSPHVGQWWDSLYKKEIANNPNTEHLPWKKLKQHERADLLPQYCADTGAVVFIDDAHKLAGRKLQLARQCIIAAKIFVLSASEEQRLPPNLRSVVMKREPQIFRLDSEVAYDATKILVWVITIVCLAIGFWEAALVLGGLQALGSGRRAARSD